MKYIIALILFSACGLSIEQKVESCKDENHFRVRTTVKKTKPADKPDWIYSGDTGDNTCLTVEQADSAKKAEYKKAEVFIEQYNKLN